MDECLKEALAYFQSVQDNSVQNDTSLLNDLPEDIETNILRSTMAIYENDFRTYFVRLVENEEKHFFSGTSYSFSFTQPLDLSALVPNQDIVRIWLTNERHVACEIYQPTYGRSFSFSLMVPSEKNPTFFGDVGAALGSMDKTSFFVTPDIALERVIRNTIRGTSENQTQLRLLSSALLTIQQVKLMNNMIDMNYLKRFEVYTNGNVPFTESVAATLDNNAQQIDQSITLLSESLLALEWEMKQLDKEKEEMRSQRNLTKELASSFRQLQQKYVFMYDQYKRASSDLMRIKRRINSKRNVRVQTFVYSYNIHQSSYCEPTSLLRGRFKPDCVLFLQVLFPTMFTCLNRFNVNTPDTCRGMGDQVCANHTHENILTLTECYNYHMDRFNTHFSEFFKNPSLQDQTTWYRVQNMCYANKKIKTNIKQFQRHILSDSTEICTVEVLLEQKKPYILFQDFSPRPLNITAPFFFTKPIVTLDDNGNITSVVFEPGDVVRIWDIGSDHIVCEIVHHGHSYSFTFIPTEAKQFTGAFLATPDFIFEKHLLNVAENFIDARNNLRLVSVSKLNQQQIDRLNEYTMYLTIQHLQSANMFVFNIIVPGSLENNKQRLRQLREVVVDQQKQCYLNAVLEEWLLKLDSPNDYNKKTIFYPVYRFQLPKEYGFCQYPIKHWSVSKIQNCMKFALYIFQDVLNCGNFIDLPTLCHQKADYEGCF